MSIVCRRLLFCCGVLLGCLVLTATDVALAEPMDESALQESLDQLLDGHPTALRTTVTLKVVDLESGDVLYDRGGDKLLTPASNLKIYTSACALDLFGPEKQFETRVVATGPITDAGVLQGDLVLIGGGDGMFSNEDLAGLAGQVAEKWHVRRIEGQVIVDNSRYASPLKGPGWMWDDEPDYYNMSISPLMVDFNLLVARLSKAADGSIAAELVPPAAYPPIRRMPSDIGEATTCSVTRRPFEHPLLLRGNLPPQEPINEELTMHDPGPWVASMFVEMLVQHQVEFSKSPEERFSSTAITVQPKNVTAEITLKGPTLTKTLKHFNYVSENAVGEVLLHEIAIARGLEPNWSNGAKVTTDWLTQTAGLESGSFRLVDGSGLSRYNCISGTSAIDLLSFMHKHTHAKVFASGLPVYEVDLENVGWPNTPDEGFDVDRVHAKSGGMSSVSTISGYLKTLSGRQLAFSLLANGYLGSNKPVRDLRGKVWRELVQYQAGEVVAE